MTVQKVGVKFRRHRADAWLGSTPEVLQGKDGTRAGTSTGNVMQQQHLVDACSEGAT